MEIVFNEKPGQIFDLFQMLYFVYNRNAEEALQKHGIPWSKDVKKAYDALVKGMEARPKEMDFFFKDGETVFFMFYAAKKIWKLETIEQFIQALSDYPEEELKRLLLNFMEANPAEGAFSGDRALPEGDALIDHIQGLDKPDPMKWNALAFLRKPGEPMKALIDFVSAFAQKYLQILKKNESTIDKFNDSLKNEIKERGARFLEEECEGIIEVGNYKRIYLSSLFLCNFTVSMEDNHDGDLYVFLGKDYKEILGHLSGKNEEEHVQTVLKCLSDPTRYQILTLLNSSTYYGQELADRLKLSLATISHHMELLNVGARIVRLELSGNRGYYTLNKEELAKCLIFLKNKFGLEF